MGELGWPNCVGMLGWFKCVGMLCWLELVFPTTGTCLFKVRPGVLSKTLSHMWGKLNLPLFLFRVGLLTLINMNSLIFLAKQCPSLPIIWKFFWVVGWPALLLWWCIGEVSFSCSLNLLPKVLEVSPMYSSLQVRSPHWNQYMAPLLLEMGFLSLGETSRFFDGAITFEVGLYTIPPTDPFNDFAETLGVWYDNMTLGFNFIGMGWACVVPWLLAPSLTSLVDLVSLFSTLSKAHLE